MTLAITGGVGSGKTAVANMFADLGVPLVDVDEIAHQLTAVGSPLLTKIAQTFGAEFVNEAGVFQREKMRKLVFEYPEKRLQLEAILHPAIYEVASHKIKKNQQLSSLNLDVETNISYQALVIPLLFSGSRYWSLIDKVLVIDCCESQQISRTMQRSGLSEQVVKKMMQAQITRTARLALADEVIENTGNLQDLRSNVLKMHQKLSLSGKIGSNP